MMHGREVGLFHSSWEADEQSGAICCGVSGAKGGDQGECGPAAGAGQASDAQRPIMDLRTRRQTVRRAGAARGSVLLFARPNCRAP
jgi:hypothetical protein